MEIPVSLFRVEEVANVMKASSNFPHLHQQPGTHLSYQNARRDTAGQPTALRNGRRYQRPSLDKADH